MKRNLILGSLAIAIAAIAFNYTDVASVDAASKGDNKALETSAAPSASTTIVISQVFGGGGGASGTYSADYVELKNISATPQSMDTLRIMYGSATGQFGSSTGNIQALPNTTLAPGQYFLIQLGTVGAGGAPVPSPDLTNTSTNLSGSSGKVALVTTAFTANTCGATATPCPLPSASIIDLVSYGVANNAEGGAPTNGGVAVTSTQGSVRKTGGCTDTDNNNADHDIITAPVPRNSTSPVAVCGAAPANDTNADFNGDGKTDFIVARGTNTPLADGLISPLRGADQEVKGRRSPAGSTESPAAPTIYWYTNLNGPGTTSVQPLGDAATDFIVTEDFDGDGKDDITVWREAPATQAAFYILRSSTGTVDVQLFGQTGDDPAVVGDYDGDNKADVAVYRCPAAAAPAGQCYYFYRGTNANPGGNVTYVPWGFGNDGFFYPYVGDFDGDGKNDFCIQRTDPTAPANGQFVLLKSNGFGVEYINWGTSSDFLIPGDYDGDGKTDFCVRRTVSNARHHWILTRTGATSFIVWGQAGDTSVPGDYDGDGKTDLAIWRGSTDAAANYFWVLNSSNGAVGLTEWGQCPTGSCDFAVAGWAVH